MMWTSYAALCEMGMVTDSNMDLDPASVFGVIPPNLAKVPRSKGGYGMENDTEKGGHIAEQSIENQQFLKRMREVREDLQSPFQIINASPIMTSDGTMGGAVHPGHSTMAGYHNNQSSFGQVPQTPYYQNVSMHGDNDHGETSAIHATSLFPQTAASTASATNLGRRYLPSTTLFTTPGLTPIPHDQQQHYSAFSSVKKDEVFSRAKQVASRLYYNQSPDMTPPSNYGYSMKSRLVPNHSQKASTPPRTGGMSAPSSSMKTARRKQHRGRTESLLAVEEAKHGDYSEKRLLFDGMNEDSTHNVDEEMDLKIGEEDNDIEHNKVAEELNGEEGIQHILEIFCTLGAAQRMLCSFHCKDAIQIYRSLPNNQYNSGFVQHQIGRGYFEMADYANAQRAFETMQRVESYR